MNNKMKTKRTRNEIEMRTCTVRFPVAALASGAAQAGLLGRKSNMERVFPDRETSRQSARELYNRPFEHPVQLPISQFVLTSTESEHSHQIALCTPFAQSNG